MLQTIRKSFAFYSIAYIGKNFNKESSSQNVASLTKDCATTINGWIFFYNLNYLLIIFVLLKKNI